MICDCIYTCMCYKFPIHIYNLIIRTEKFLTKYPSVLNDCEVMEGTSTSCRKDLGDRGKLRHWSRGHVFIVRGCGHIDTWKPIYK